MPAAEDWTPLRWPSGPLELARRERTGALTPESRQALRHWHEPAALDFLRDAPVNCLVVSWAGGLPQDAEQQRTMRPLLDRARADNLNVVGLVDGTADRAASVASARAAGLAGIATDSNLPQESPAIWWGQRKRMPRTSNASLFALGDGVWPNVKAPDRGPTAGPTGAPWVDSNGWAIRLARLRAHGKPVWVAADPPANPAEVLRSSSYLLALADAEAYGARWVLSFDETLRLGLAAKDAAAVDVWKSLSAALRLFRTHRAWQDYQPVGALAVISDFSGSNQYLSEEILNLTARRLLPYRIIETATAFKASFSGLRAILFPDEQPPAAELHRKLVEFVEAGGLLMTGPAWKGTEGDPGPGDVYHRYRIRHLGKGRIAVPVDDSPDPFLMAADVHLMMSHRHDLIRVWNPGSLSCHYTAAPGVQRAIVHLINYTMREPGHEVTLGFKAPYRTARFWRLEQPAESIRLPVVSKGPEIELHLPEFGVYTAIELES